MNRWLLHYSRPAKSLPAIEARRIHIAGRIGVIAAVLIFMGTYVYGIATYGLFFGFVLGWLPSGVAAWLTAISVTSLVAMDTRYIAAAKQRLSLFVRAILNVSHK